jgi:tetratricopeptide (TPR) repeat protein/tRNA A-37 threonylcarbamoyl transferase component Bud32
MQDQRIAHFEIREKIGQGAMGVVYRARDTVLNRDVALKLIRPELTETPRARNRFVQECRTAAAVNHAGIATIYEAGEAEDGQLYFASELVHGESLEKRIHRGALSSDDVLEIGVHLSRALAAAHKHGIVHRDIKPANLMLLDDGSVKVLDFGLARLRATDDSEPPEVESSSAVTQTQIGLAVGTPAYMAPEQAAGDPVDGRADIFACGSVLYAAASGQSAFRSDSVAETLRRIIVAEPTPLESLAPKIPKDLCGVIRRAMAKEPAARYASADQLADALEAVRRGERVDYPGVETRRFKKRWAVAIGIAAVVAIAFLAGVWAKPVFEFGSRDWLLVADVDNLTGDAAFDLALRTALEADLQQSRWAVVFDQARVAETLRLMRRAPDTRIDEEVGRDVCRFAGVRALLLPRILSVGEAYELQVILVDPVNGSHVDRVRVTSRGREQVLLEGIDELTKRVRASIGESLDSIAESDVPVARVTTSSWDALNYFSIGGQKWREANYTDAARMFELALEKDPRFVSAKGSLALLLMQFLDEPERGKRLLAEARDESGDLPERERLLIEAVGLQFVEEDFEAALEAYHVIAELYPGVMQAYNNSGRILLGLRRYDEAARMLERAHEAAPRSSVPLSNLYFLRLNLLHDPSGAEQAARAMVELGPTTANFRNLLGWSLIAQSRFDDAVVELERVLADEPRHPYALPNTAHTLFILGRSGEAVPLYRRQYDRFASSDSSLRTAPARDLGLALMDAGRTEEAHAVLDEELLALEADGSSVRDMLMQSHLHAIAGRAGEARRLVEASVAAGVGDAASRVSLAQAHALLGDDESALDELLRAMDQGYADPYFPRVMPIFRSLHGDPRFEALFE